MLRLTSLKQGDMLGTYEAVPGGLKRIGKGAVEAMAAYGA